MIGFRPYTPTLQRKLWMMLVYFDRLAELQALRPTVDSAADLDFIQRKIDEVVQGHRPELSASYYRWEPGAHA